MLYLDILLVFEFCLFIAAIFITNVDLLSPGVCTITVTLVATMLLKFVEKSWDVKISFDEVLIILAGLFAILFAEFVTKKFRVKRKMVIKAIHDNHYSIQINTLLMRVLIILSVVFLVFYVFEIYRKGVGLGAGGLFSIGVVANSLSDGTERLSFIGKVAYQYNSLIAYPFCWIFSQDVFKRKVSKRYLFDLIPVICCLATQFFGANRHNMLRVILAVVFCSIVTLRQNKAVKKRDKKKIIRRLVFFFAMFLIVFYFARDVVKVSTHSISFAEYIIYYLSSPIVLFGKYLISPTSVRAVSNLFGETCFTGFYATLMRWGIVDNVITETNHTAIGGYSGIRTGNTYTFFMRPYHDFGIVGVIVLTFLIYFIVCFMYHKKICKGIRSAKSYRNRMMIIIYLSYFYYMFPLAVSDFYLSIESKIMTLFYLAIIYLICKYLIKIDENQTQ